MKKPVLQFKEPIRDVMADWIGVHYPNGQSTIVAWWARRPDGTVEPVFEGAVSNAAGYAGPTIERPRKAQPPEVMHVEDPNEFARLEYIRTEHPGKPVGEE